MEIAEPLAAIEIEARYDEVMLIVSLNGLIVGDVFLEARPHIEVADQMQAIGGRLGYQLLHADLRHRLELGVSTDANGGADPPVSVIVCTRDRPLELRSCLESIRRLRSQPHEVLVVDNGSADASAIRAVCEEHSAAYVSEPDPGQSRARNRGIATAEGELVAFTDDDCIVDPGWLDGLGSSFEEPLVMAVTGHVGPQGLDRRSQHVFERHGGFERHDHRRVFDASSTTPIGGARSAGAGANMIFRRRLFDLIGGFAEDLGPGTPARSSDDKYIFFRLLAAGHRIVYEPRRVVWHRHRPEMDELWGILRDYGTAEVAYTLRALLRDGDPEGLRVWSWWWGHVRAEVREDPRRTKVPRRAPVEEAVGLLNGIPAWTRSVRSRRHLEPISPRDEAGRAAPGAGRGEARAADVSVGHEGPELTVAIASRNRSASLRRVLLALADSNYPSERFEVVVVLDGGTDDSAAMTRELTVPYELRVLERPWGGLAATRNAGARAAANPVVVFLDDDVVPEPGLLAAHASAVGDGAERIVLGAYPPADLGTGFWARRLRIWWADHFARKGRADHRWTYVDFVDGNCSMRRDLFDRLGGFHEGFRGGRRQDWDLGYRTLAAGTEVVYEPLARAMHHFDADFGAALRNAREEGRLDVTLAARHPQLLGHLPLARVAPGLLSGARRITASSRAASRPGTRGAILRSLGMLERAGLNERWQATADLALNGSYAAGLLEAVGDLGALRDLVQPVLDGEASALVELELDGGAPLELVPGGGAVDVLLTRGGRPLARVPATRHGEQWDSFDFVDRAARALTDVAPVEALMGLPAPEREASSALAPS